MRLQEIRRIMKENDRYAKMLEEYDKTGKLPLKKIRRSFTLRQMTINILKKESEKTGNSMSDIIDDAVEKMEEHKKVRK